jgi:hypothetical protein
VFHLSTAATRRATSTTTTTTTTREVRQSLSVTTNRTFYESRGTSVPRWESIIKHTQISQGACLWAHTFFIHILERAQGSGLPPPHLVLPCNGPCVPRAFLLSRQTAHSLAAPKCKGMDGYHHLHWAAAALLLCSPKHTTTHATSLPPVDCRGCARRQGARSAQPS